MVNQYGERTTLLYDALGWESSRTLANNLTLSHTYDAAGRQTSLWALWPSGQALAAYDAAGRQTGVVELDGSVVTYGYDARGQLISEWRSGSSAYHTTYTYDPAGNRLVKEEGGVLTAYAYNAANAMTLISPAGSAPVTQSYDACGNLTGQNAGGVLSTYMWDAQDRLVVAATAASVDTFSYDAFGHRVTKLSSLGLGTQNRAYYTPVASGYGGLSSHRQYQASYSRFFAADLQGHTR